MNLNEDFLLFEATPGKRVVFLPDAPAFTIIAASKDMRQFVGRTNEQMVGKSVFETFPANPDDTDATGHKNLRASLQYVVQHKAPHQMEKQRYDVATEDGSFNEIYWQNTSTPVLNGEGAVIYIIHTAEDITEKVKAAEQEEKIKGLEQAYGLFMQAPFAIHIFTGPDLIIDLANPPTLELWGKTEDVTGKRFLDVLPELKEQGYDAIMQEVMQTGKPRFFYEVPLALNRSGKEPVGYFNFVYQPYYKEGALKAESVLIIANEVTQQVLAKRSIEESEARLNSIVEQTPAPTLVLRGDDYLIEHINGPMLQIMGRGEEVNGQPFLSIMPELEGQYAWQQVKRVYCEGIFFDQREVLVPHNRTGVMQDYYYNVAYRPLKEDGRITGMIQVAIDVTEQVLSRKKLEESEERYRTLLEETTVATAFYTGPEVRIMYANATMLRYWGKGREVIGKTFRQALPELESQPFPDLLEAVYATGELYVGTEEKAELRVAGELRPFYFNFTYKALRDAEGRVYAVHHTAIDVTEQVLARRKLEQNEKHLETAFEQARLSKEAAELGTFDMNLEEGTLHRDDRCRTLFGISHRRPVTYEKDFTDGLHPDDRERVLKVIDRLFIKSISNGDYDVEYRTVGAEDSRVRWVRAKGKVYFNLEDKPVRFIGSALDITEQVTALQKIETLVEERTKELATANETLHDINRELQRSNHYLEEFAHAASHDLKEPVRKIHFFTTQLKEQLKSYLKEGETRSFNRIENATERMGNLIDDLLLYSHVSQRPHEKEPVDLSEKVQRVLEDLELDIQEKAAVINVEKLPVVNGYGRQLQQLFQNLISNALKYSKADLPPRIEITAVPDEQEGKRYHLIRVRDNGIGFDQEHDEKIFQMFARLHGKAEYSGTGVGLSIVKKVVENHNGFIRVESIVGKGSVFEIYLPV